MTHREFIQWLRKVEEQFPVTRWKVRGIHAWPLIRLSLYASEFHARTPEFSLGAGWFRRLQIVGGAFTSWARAYWQDRSRNQNPAERADAVFLTYSIGRQPLMEGRRYDVLSAPYVDLLTRLGKRSLVWEMSPFGDYNLPRYTASFLIQPYIVSLRVLCQVLPLGQDKVELDRYGEFVAWVDAAGLTFPHSNVMRIRRDMLFLRRLADRFGAWLSRARPSLGFVADTGLREQAFCLACRELGITSIEIQHGVQGEVHPSYGSWFAVPPEGYETRARVFWCWDGESADAINRWGGMAPGAHVAVEGGDPWREMWMNGESELARQTHAAIEKRKVATGAERHILITLSSYGELLPASVLEAIRGSPPEWCYWIRLHPVNQVRRRAEANRVLRAYRLDLELMDFASEAPLHALLRHMDCHLTVSLSTVVAEAAAIGVPSVACVAEAKEFYPTESGAGLLTVALTGRDVIEALHLLLERACAVPDAVRPQPGRAMELLLR